MKRLFTEKWSQYHLLKTCSGLSNHLPETLLYTENAFWSMLERDKRVIVKPSTGRLGYGVLQVSDAGDNRYEYHIENQHVTESGKEQIAHFLSNDYACKNNRCIVQQAIPLAKIDGCPFDIRVMVQRKRFGSPWEVTGKAVKVAMDGYIVTNASKMILPFEQAMKAASLSHVAEEVVDHVALSAARHLRRWKVNKLGLDIGIDETGNAWIIEVNVRPSIGIFTFLEDKEIYKRMIHYNKR